MDTDDKIIFVPSFRYPISKGQLDIVLTPSSLEFEFDAKRIDRTGYEVMKTERDILMTELRGLGAFVMDWEPDMLLSTALAGARGF